VGATIRALRRTAAGPGAELEIERPEPGEDEVLVRTAASGHAAKVMFPGG
jgi:NADPH:quinone reductase-like Zn-dependent oxidoreductase